jgi:urease accessory protein
VRRFAAAVFVLLNADPALAHSTIPGATGFIGGLLHPFVAPAHLMALGALGLLLGQQAARERTVLLAIFAVALAAGVAAIASALAAQNPDVAVLAAAAILGLLVALARPVALIGVAPVLFVTGVAIELDSVPQEISVAETLLALAGTSVTVFLIPTLLAMLMACLRQDWQRIAMRIVGSWIAASAMLVLVLRLAK